MIRNCLPLRGIALRFAPLLVLTVISLPLAGADWKPLSGAQAGPGDRWSVGHGVTTLRFDPGMLESLGWTVRGAITASSGALPDGYRLSIAAGSRLELWAPRAAFDGFADGKLAHDGRLAIEHAGGAIRLDDFMLQPSGPETLALKNAAGETWFELRHVHTMLYPEAGAATFLNMDLAIAGPLAEQLGQPEWTGLGVGQAFMETSLDVPEGETPQGVVGCTSPNWHDGSNFLTDIELYEMPEVQQAARQAGVRVAVAPSARLRNVGTADVPWYVKFTTLPGDTYPAPYGRDQHPFLVWAMYRELSGVVQQIGVSDVKHAFFAQNTVCSCAGGNILWSAGSSPNGQGCADLYGWATNDNPTHLGPRSELVAAAGEWEQCGSLFAPGGAPPGPCDPTSSGATLDEFERRLVVQESMLGVNGASYWMEAWYVVRDDIDIFNSMAHVTVSPVLNGSVWIFSPGGTVPGAAIDEWVAPGTATATQQHTRVATASGHYSLTVKVTNLGGGDYRYAYALMNYDFDPGFDRLAFEIPQGVTVSNTGFADADGPGANDWTASTAGGELSFAAPAAALGWGRMATFTFEADTPPISSAATIGIAEPAAETQVGILGLSLSSIFQDGFEEPEL